MISVKQQDNRYTIEFSRQDVSDIFLIKLLRKCKVDQTLDNNQMSQKDAWDLSEEIKDNWFKNNKSWIFEKIGVSENESDY